MKLFLLTLHAFKLFKIYLVINPIFPEKNLNKIAVNCHVFKC